MEQGSWDNLRAKAGYISQVVLTGNHYESQKSNENAEVKNKMLIQTSEEKKSDSRMQDLARKTGDIMLYSMRRDISTCI